MTISSIHCISRKTLGMITALAHFAQTIAVIVLMRNSERLLAGSSRLPVFRTARTFTPDAPPDTGPTYKLEQIGHFDIGWAIMVFFFLSGLFQTIGLTFDTYTEDLRNAIQLRYLEYTLSAAVMMGCIALESGIHDIWALVSIMFLISATNLLGMLADYAVDQKFYDASIVWYAHWIAWLCLIIAYSCVWAAFAYNAAVYTPPAFVYAIVIVMFALFSCFGVVQYWDLNKRIQYLEHNSHTGSFPHLEDVCFAYDVLSISAKSILAWLVLSAALAGSKIA